jgi:hypothetical protein
MTLTLARVTRRLPLIFRPSLWGGVSRVAESAFTRGVAIGDARGYERALRDVKRESLAALASQPAPAREASLT